MNKMNVEQFHKVCNILKASRDITDFENTDKGVKVYVNNASVCIDTNGSVDNTYKVLTRFLNSIRKG